MWGQWYPYNEQITNRYAVGCVAVALGQILKYHADLPGFDFSRMPLYSTESVPELARFLRYIGDKVEMDYGYSSSSNIYYAQAALSDMGYAYTFNSSHNINEITKSLKNRRPVYMRGANIADNVGHAWVCEGLTEASTDIGYALIVPTGQLGDASGPFTTMGERGSSSMMQKFYYNWGWDGNSNGFYVDPINWPSQVYFGDQMMSLTNIRKKMNMNKRIKTLFLLLPIFAAGLWGCASDGDADNPVDNNPYEPIELEAEEFYVSEAMQPFAFDMLGEICCQTEGSVVVSPLSAAIMVGMLANAADDDVCAEFLAAMGVSDVQKLWLNSYFGKLQQSLPGIDKEAKMRLDNGVWLNSGSGELKREPQTDMCRSCIMII